MQAISVYLYPNKVDVFTNLHSDWLQERYRRVYNRNVKIYRGVDNRIDLQVKNSDEKAVSITGYHFVFNLINPETQKLLISKDCSDVDDSSPSRGRMYVILSESEVSNIEPGFYHYTIVRESRQALEDGTYSVTQRETLYIDSQYGAYAVAELGNNIQGEPLDSVKIISFRNYEPFNPGEQKYFISSIIDAKPEINNPQSLHTFQFNMSNFSGDIVIQGSLSEGGNPQVWTTIETITANQDNVLYQNVIGKYHWFRVKHFPNTAITNYGTVDSILYR